MIRKREDALSPKTPKSLSKRQRFLNNQWHHDTELSQQREAEIEDDENVGNEQQEEAYDNVEQLVTAHGTTIDFDDKEFRLHFAISSSTSEVLTASYLSPSNGNLLLKSLQQRYGIDRADFLIAVFQFLEPDFLLQNCALVCTHWYHLSHNLLVSGSADLYNRTHVSTPNDASLCRASKILDRRFFGCSAGNKEETKAFKQQQIYTSPGVTDYEKHTVEVDHICAQYSPANDTENIWQSSPQQQQQQTVTPASPLGLVSSPSSIFFFFSASWPSMSPIALSPFAQTGGETISNSNNNNNTSVTTNNVAFDLSALHDAWSASITAEQFESSAHNELASVELEETHKKLADWTSAASVQFTLTKPCELKQEEDSCLQNKASEQQLWDQVPLFKNIRQAMLERDSGLLPAASAAVAFSFAEQV